MRPLWWCRRHGSGVQRSTAQYRFDKLALDCGHSLHACYRCCTAVRTRQAEALSAHDPAASRVSVLVRGPWQKTTPIPRSRPLVGSAPSRERAIRFRPRRHASGRSAVGPRPSQERPSPNRHDPSPVDRRRRGLSRPWCHVRRRRLPSPAKLRPCRWGRVRLHRPPVALERPHRLRVRLLHGESVRRLRRHRRLRVASPRTSQRTPRRRMQRRS